MVNEKLIKQDLSGSYCLVFLNEKGVQEEEIKEIFSQFGNAVNIKRAGDLFGYHFVRYETLDEVHKAIKGLENHGLIQLQEHRPKKSNHYKPNMKNDFSKEKENHYINDWKNNKSANNNNYNKKGEKSSNNYNYRDNNNNSNYRFSNNYHDRYEPSYGFPVRHKVLDKDILLKPNSNNSSLEYTETSMDKTITDSAYESCNILNNTESVSLESTNTTLNKIGSNLTISSLSKKSIKNSTNNVNNVPNFNTKIVEIEMSEKTQTKKNKGSFEEFPALINSKGQIMDRVGGKEIIIKAEEVVVGNIQSNFTPAYFLHLFHRFDPLAVSNVYCLPNSKQYYCFVYFKTKKDSIEVEKQFDQHDLFGHRLLVLRPDSLVEAAMY